MNKNLLAILVILVVIGIYYVNNKVKVNEWLSKAQTAQIMGTSVFDPKALTEKITANWNEDFVRKQLQDFVVKDGISLPQGWKLDQKMINDKYITVIVPPNPVDENDYIAPRLSADLMDALPEQHMCSGGDSEITTCVVGENIETHRAFHLMVYF